MEVKVTDCYLAYTVDKSNCPALAAGAVLFFVSNEAQALHLFASDNQSDTPTTTGTYEFFVRQDNGGSLRPYLRIGFPSGTAEGTSDIPHEFVLSFNNPQAVLSIIQGYLGMDWDALIRTPTAKNTAPQRFTMTLTNPDSGHETTGTFSTASILNTCWSETAPDIIHQTSDFMQYVLLPFILLACSLALHAQPVSIVFIGNSITYGACLTDPSTEAPPVHTAALLREKGYEVAFANCGYSGSTTVDFLPGDKLLPRVVQAADSLAGWAGRSCSP